MTPVAVRPVRTGDHPAVLDVIASSFGAEGRHATISAVVESLRAEGLMRHERVAEVDGVVVGYVALSLAWLDARRRLVEVGVLSPLAVHAAHQAAGVGTALVRSVLEAADATGVPLVFLEGSPGYYSARGFRPAAEVGLTPPSGRIPGPACQVALLAAHELWMTGGLVYPDVWWRNDLVGLRDPLLAELEEPGSPPPDD